MTIANTTRPHEGSDATALAFTAIAARKARQLIEEDGDPELKLRVAVNGGGCSGFQYGFSFDKHQADDDLAVERDGVRLLVDPLSLQYLAGAEIDFTEDISGSQFVIRNLAARATCSCGTSFAV